MIDIKKDLSYEAQLAVREARMLDERHAMGGLIGGSTISHVQSAVVAVAVAAEGWGDRPHRWWNAEIPPRDELVAILQKNEIDGWFWTGEWENNIRAGRDWKMVNRDNKARWARTALGDTPEVARVIFRIGE